MSMKSLPEGYKLHAYNEDTGEWMFPNSRFQWQQGIDPTRSNKRIIELEKAIETMRADFAQGITAQEENYQQMHRNRLILGLAMGMLWETVGARWIKVPEELQNAFLTKAMKVLEVIDG